MINDVIEKKISELPDNIRRAVEQFDWATEILHIANDHHLQIDTIDTFRQETLLVIVGLTNAADFEKNLVSHLGISHDLAYKLVSDANDHIFRPLQKMSFTHNKPDELESDTVYHSDISNVMSNHGIELVDEFKSEPRPENELQNLADSLFNKKPPVKTQNNETDKVVNENLHKPTSYNEEIDVADLRGITGHRIDTSILTQSDPEQILNTDSLKKSFSKNDSKLQSLDSSVFTTARISKTELFNVSPSKEELVIENGDFLKHIGAS